MAPGSMAWAVNTSDVAGAWPHVGALANESVRIATYYTTMLCTPTRGAFMTGGSAASRAPPRRHRRLQDYGLPANETTIADKLKGAGYATAHNGEEDHFTRILQGLGDFQASSLADGASYYTVDDLLKINGTHNSFLFVDRAVAVVGAHDASIPLFLYLALQDTHAPIQAPAGYADDAACASIGSSRHYPDARREFCGMVRARAHIKYSTRLQCPGADESIANVTAAIDANFGKRNSVIVIAGDNGGIVKGGGNNWPLRGQKGQPWEGGVRNHALIRAPGRLAPGLYDKGMVHVVDLHATLVALAGGASAYEIDGLDVWAALRDGSPSPRSEVLLMYDPCAQHGPLAVNCSAPAYSYRDGDYKLVHPSIINDTWIMPPPSVGAAYADDGAPSCVHPEPHGAVSLDAACVSLVDNATYLYDLSVDPEERVDLAAEKPDVVFAIQAKVLDFVARHEMYPCNVPGGPCFDVDQAGNASCTALGYFRPWIRN
ncbi:sulfuric ester hydrolase [Aureococcus anophagefferens]|nr:sulfuric ester hydrolase [Aureococcus anophagefferens]